MGSEHPAEVQVSTIPKIVGSDLEHFEAARLMFCCGDPEFSDEIYEVEERKFPKQKSLIF